MHTIFFANLNASFIPDIRLWLFSCRILNFLSNLPCSRSRRIECGKKPLTPQSAIPRRAWNPYHPCSYRDCHARHCHSAYRVKTGLKHLNLKKGLSCFRSDFKWYCSCICGSIRLSLVKYVINERTKTTGCITLVFLITMHQESIYISLKNNSLTTTFSYWWRQE